MDIFTIGHSTHPIGHFVSLLRQQGIERLADVRSTPFSRFNPQFNRAALAQSLAAAGIQYEFMGETLGARSTDPACFENGRVSYARLAESAPFKRGIRELLSFAKSERVAIMCAEREPLDCHRTILVGRILEREGAAVRHILSDGAIEENRHAMERLVAKLKLPADDLFRDDAQRFEAACDAQGVRMAYSPKKSYGPRKA